MFLGMATLPAGSRIYAIGDVHGRLDCLERLFTDIQSDIQARPVSSSKTVMLGDYVDRGPDSRGVLDFLIAQSDNPDVICLRGNHDDRLLEFVEAPDEFSEGFLRYGGWETLASYGVTASLFRRNVANLSRSMAKRMPGSHKKFLSRLPLFYEEGDYFFCHAGVRPGVALHNQEKHDLMWIRGEFLGFEGSFGKVVVHGHTPGIQVEVVPNRINLDTMAFETGRLSCAILEGDSYNFMQTGL